MAQSNPLTNLSKNVAAVEEKVEEIKTLPFWTKPIPYGEEARRVDIVTEYQGELVKALFKTLLQWSEILAHSYFLYYISAHEAILQNMRDHEVYGKWGPVYTRIMLARNEILYRVYIIECSTFLPPSSREWIELFKHEDARFDQEQHAVTFDILEAAHHRLRALTFSCQLHFYCHYESVRVMEVEDQR